MSTSIRVLRSRHGWPRGYFRELIGKRIPFAAPSGAPRTGVLRRVHDGPTELVFRFDDVRPDDTDAGCLTEPSDVEIALERLNEQALGALDD